MMMRAALGELIKALMETQENIFLDRMEGIMLRMRD